jgi:sec-independent protein translocase protein TatA
MMGLDNPIHIIFLFLLILLVFGAKRLPEIGRSIGTGLRGFKHALNEEDDKKSVTLHSDDPDTTVLTMEADHDVSNEAIHNVANAVNHDVPREAVHNVATDGSHDVPKEAIHNVAKHQLR